MHMHRRQHLAVLLVLAAGLAGWASGQSAETPAATAPATAPVAKLHCVVLNEATEATPRTEVTVHVLGTAGWVPYNGAATGKGGACDLAFAGGRPELLMLRATAPGYKDAEVYYLPDPEEVIPWLTITLTGAQTLTGTVVNADDEPVPDAEVVLDMPAGPRKARSDAKGQFVLEDLMPIRTTLRVEVPGVGSATYRVDLARQTEPLRIMLRPQRRVTLRIVDADRKPVPGLKVRFLAPRETEGQTDAGGRLIVPGVGGGGVAVQFSLEDKFYCLDESVMRFDIDEGTEPVEVEVFAVRGGRVCGQVVEVIEGETQGIPAATVWLVEGGRPGRNVMTDEDGNFELNGVPPDSYLVAAGHPTYATSLGAAGVQAGKEVQLKFTLGQGATIRGTVVDAEGKPVERAIVRVSGWHPKAGGQPASEPAEAIELPWRATRTDSQGRYILEYLPAGRVTLEAVGPEGPYRSEANIQITDRQEVIEQNLTLRPSQPKAPL